MVKSELTKGVSQASIQGPVRINIYINDISSFEYE